MRLRVAQVNPFFAGPGGIERYVRELARELSQDADVTLVVGAGERGLPHPSIPVPFLRWPSFLSSITFSLGSTSILGRNRFDVIHAHGASAFRQDVLTAHSCHKRWFHESLAKTPRGSKAWFRKRLNPVHPFTIFIESIQYRGGNTGTIVAISESVRDDLVRYHGVSPDKVEVVHSAVDSMVFTPENRGRYRSEVRSRHGLAPEDPVFLFVANEFRRKGLRPLLEAFALLPDREAKLLVVGRDDPAPYRGLARRLGIEGRVVFAPASNAVHEIFAAADAFVLPTTYEPYGLVVLEAMAAGLPVVVSRLAGVSELLAHGESALLLEEPEDPEEIASRMHTLLTGDRGLALARAGRTIAEGLTWRSVAAKYLDLYHRIAARKREGIATSDRSP